VHTVLSTSLHDQVHLTVYIRYWGRGDGLRLSYYLSLINQVQYTERMQCMLIFRLLCGSVDGRSLSAFS